MRWGREELYRRRYEFGRCQYCDTRFLKRRAKAKFCSTRCSSEARRVYLDIPSCLDSADRKIDKNIGYVRVYAPMHPEANSRGYVYEHRLIAEKKIGRRLVKGEIVHHINGIRWDNRPENLEVMTTSEHIDYLGGEAKRCGNRLISGLASDKREIEGSTPSAPIKHLKARLVF